MESTIFYFSTQRNNSIKREEEGMGFFFLKIYWEVHDDVKKVLEVHPSCFLLSLNIQGGMPSLTPKRQCPS